MSLFIASLNSGSNGNCYYIGNGSEAVLIDAGISCRETEKRMDRLNLSMNTVKAIFVSHEHSDHITGIPAISKKYQLPVYITEGTLKNIPLPVNTEHVHIIKAPDKVTIGALEVISFNKFHDATEPVSFVVSDQQTHVGVFTDMGHCCKELIRHFNYCHAAFLESNYCEEMLENGTYPLHLKKRIRGNKGHLSNDQALELFSKYRGIQLSHLILSHLSQNNNTMEKVWQLFSRDSGNTEIIVASRYKETPVYEIKPTAASKRIVIKKFPAPASNQLSLF